MLLKDKVAVITGGAGLNGLGFATAKLMAAHGARVAILDLARAEPAAAAAKLGDGHLGLVGRRDRQGLVRRRRGRGAQGLRRGASTCWSTTPASRARPAKTLDITGADYEQHSRREPARHAVHVAGCAAGDAAQKRFDRLHFVGVGPARRRHPWRPALFGRQGRRARPGPRDGARVRPRRHSRQQHHARPDRHRHHQRQAHRREEGRDRRDDPARRLGRADDIAGACVFLASDLSLYCTGITLDVNGGMLIH